MADVWNVDQYERFRIERRQPALDLLASVDVRPGMKVIDLGCGTGEITRELHDMLPDAETIGIDSSEAMLAKSATYQAPGLTFKRDNILHVESRAEYDLVFSNAALQWVPNHPILFEKIRQALKPGGQIAIQIPKNGDHPSQAIAFALDQEHPYSDYVPLRIDKNVLAPEEYTMLLHRLGFVDIDVRLKVYLHLLKNKEEVLEWVKGTFLTDYQRKMPRSVYNSFYEEYREELMERLPDEQPFPFTFKRILMRGRVPQ